MQLTILSLQTPIFVNTVSSVKAVGVNGLKVIFLLPADCSTVLGGSPHSSTPRELGAEEHRSRSERYGWESLIEPFFQVWIYSTDPGLACTRTGTHMETAKTLACAAIHHLSETLRSPHRHPLRVLG